MYAKRLNTRFFCFFIMIAATRQLFHGLRVKRMCQKEKLALYISGAMHSAA